MSPPSQGSSSPSSYLVGLPEEIQLRILMFLPVGDLTRCKRVCRALSSKIEDDLQVQYKMGLELAGLIDGPAREPPLLTRVHNLRGWSAPWTAGLSIQKVILPGNSLFVSVWTCTGCYFLYEETQQTDVPAVLRLHRPSSTPSDTLSGVSDFSTVLTAWREVIPSIGRIRSCSVNPTEDMVVITKGTDPGEIPLCVVLSISEDITPHPSATQSVFRASHGSTCETHDRIESEGDLMSWSIHPAQWPSDEPSEMQVINWKTGAVVWRYLGDSSAKCHFIDSRHILVVDRHGLHVYAFDPHTSAAKPPRWAATADRLLHLAFPELAEGSRLTEVQCFVPGPRWLSNDDPVFQPDPTPDSEMNARRAECTKLHELTPNARQVPACFRNCFCISPTSFTYPTLMPNRKIAPDIKERAIYLLSAGWQVHDIVAALGVSKRSLGRWQASYEHHGHLTTNTSLCGRPQKLGPKLLDDLRMLYEERPGIYLGEVVEWFAIHRDLPVSITTIHRALGRLGLTYKKLHRAAVERDEVSRRQWIQHITSRFAANQLVFADESSKDDRTMLRRYGRAPTGRRAMDIWSTNRGVRYSILPALSLSGILTVRVVPGSVVGTIFFDWVVSDLLPKMNPYPGPNSVLIVDNCRTHKSEALREVIEAAGCLYIFLPPYSPDFNPIEEAFSCLKYYLRRHGERLLGSGTPEVDLMEACVAAVTPEKAATWYRHSGYVV